MAGTADSRYGPLGYSFDLRIPVVNNAYLGYYAAAEVETVWFHATRVLRSSGCRRRRSCSIAATNDPLGHRLEVTIAPAAPASSSVESRIAPGSGPLAGQASLSGAAFEAAAGERFLGFGERSNAVDQTGRRVFNWAEEGPFSGGNDEDVLRPLIPDFTFPTGPTATNFPIPWLVSTRGLRLPDRPDGALHLRPRDNAAPTPGRPRPRRRASRFTVFAGPAPAAVLRRYSDVGRPPARPAAVDLRPVVPADARAPPVRAGRPLPRARTCRSPSPRPTRTTCPAAPTSAATPRSASASPATTRAGYRITTYFNPHVCTAYSAGLRRGAAERLAACGTPAATPTC